MQAMTNRNLVEDRLDGSRNFISWKSRLHITLEKIDLMRLIEGTLPATTTAEEKVEWKIDDVKDRNIIIYSIRDHLLPHISTLKTTYLMYDVLKKMFERNNTNRALTLKHQLQNLKMTKDDTIDTFFMKISEIKISVRCHWRNHNRKRACHDYSQCSSNPLGTFHSKYQWKRRFTSV
jgi:hypothetical protein